MINSTGHCIIIVSIPFLCSFQVLISQYHLKCTPPPKKKIIFYHVFKCIIKHRLTKYPFSQAKNKGFIDLKVSFTVTVFHNTITVKFQIEHFKFYTLLVQYTQSHSIIFKTQNKCLIFKKKGSIHENCFS